MAITLLTCNIGHTSKEKFLTWKSISAEFSDDVSIKVQCEGPIYKEFIIYAFNKSFKLRDKELKEIEGLSLSLLNITYEEGYTETGGESIYFKLSNFVFAKAGDKLKTATIQIQKDNLQINIDFIDPPEIQ